MLCDPSLSVGFCGERADRDWMALRDTDLHGERPVVKRDHPIGGLGVVRPDQGKRLGRPRITAAKHARIVEMLAQGDGIRATAKAVGTGNETVHRIARELRQAVGAS
jgi:hypothetical protein